MMGADIQAAKDIQIGRGDGKSFQELSSQEAQQGNAIQIYTSTGTNDYVRYFVSEAEGRLMAISSDGARNRTVAEGLINHEVFAAQDAGGRTLTNRQGNFVLAVDLQFSKVPGSDAPVGKGKYYKAYRWEMKFASRARQ